MKKTLFIVALTALLALTFAAPSLAGDALDRILKKGELRIGTTANQPPMTARTKAGKIIGLDVDLAELIAMNMGVDVKFVTMPFSELLPAMHAGKVDMILSAMSMLPERNLKVAFVGPYFVSGKGVITKTKMIASLQGPDGLNNPKFKLAALKGGTSEMFAEGAAPKAQLITTTNYDEAVNLLLADKVDAIIADFPFCALTAYRYKDKGVIAGDAPMSFDPLGIAIPEDTLLLNWLQNFMMMVSGSGALKRLTDRWFAGGAWINELP
ncbi:MAG: transporter substrate-binding domain-containing protein [Deltaproteobacteria bacterium]|nr:transporter substrate-binding domain-containing protein [Deltaproteobacteria bacterium]